MCLDFFSLALSQTVEMASNNQSHLINDHIPNIKLNGSTVILGGTTSQSDNSGTILARGTEWSMTASITQPPGIAIPIPTATPVPVSWPR